VKLCDISIMPHCLSKALALISLPDADGRAVRLGSPR